jgi:hypothetical protein
MTILDVNTGQQFASISDAINGSNEGDTINISAGTYVEDFPKIFHSLVLQGIGGLAHLVTPGQPTNGQAILVQDANSLTLNHIELSGASVPDRNGAGVRFESGKTLTITDSWIHDNQNGVLAGAIAGAVVTINRTEVNNNGDGSGSTHGIYIGIVGSLLVENSYFHDNIVGHDIKSRANITTIEGNRIQSEAGSESYQIDLPNGGAATIKGNILEKGPNAQNPSMIHYGGEVAAVIEPAKLEVDDNIVIFQGGSRFIFNESLTAAGTVVLPNLLNNSFFGINTSQLSNDPLAALGNLFAAAAASLDTSQPFDVSCFREGTSILTRYVSRRVEDLKVGDEVITLDGIKPITWIGRRSISAAHHPHPRKVLPVRIDAGAFDNGLPSRPLFLSPDHSVYWNGVLIPVGRLINGTTVQQIAMDEFTYYHIELDEHSVILAESLPVETYLDTGDRPNFEGATTVLHPDFSAHRWESHGYAPLMIIGPTFDDVVERLKSRERIAA